MRAKNRVSNSRFECNSALILREKTTTQIVLRKKISYIKTYMYFMQAKIMFLFQNAEQ